MTELPATELFHHLDEPEAFLALLERSDEDVLVALGNKPLLVRLPGTQAGARARLVSCLLHGNEDSGFRAVLNHLRSGPRHPFDLWVFIGNVRAATQEGWFAHRFLDDQEDFNRVWGLDPPTTRMRRCAGAVLAELAAVELEAAVDLHNNTGRNPFYAVLPDGKPEVLALAGACADLGLFWGARSYTLMESLTDRCPAIALECGLPGLDASAAFAAAALGRFLEAEAFDDGRPAELFEVRYRIRVRGEVGFAFGGELTDELDLVLKPGLDAANFGMLLAGTEIGRVPPGTALPLEATGRHGEDCSDRFFQAREDGALIVTEDITPVMMTTTALQARRDCLFYVARRLPDAARLPAGLPPEPPAGTEPF